MIIAPMIFMFAATLTALALLIRDNIAAGNMLLVVFAVALLGLAVVLVARSYKVLAKKTEL